MAAIQSRRLRHRKRTAPTTGPLASGRPVPPPQTQIHAGHGDVSALQQQSVYALARPTDQAPPQNHHRFLQRQERRTSSLGHSLPPCPPTMLPIRFVNLMCLTRWFKSCDFKQNDYSEYIRLNAKIIRCGRLKNGCFLGLVVLSLAGLNLAGRTPPDASDPLGFFSSVADKMLRSTFSFGVTNIPVCSNGVFVYSPAIQRILQPLGECLRRLEYKLFPDGLPPCFLGDQ